MNTVSRQSVLSDVSAPTAPGTMIVVVGPSGAGKDSVMNVAARHFAGEELLAFARRVITRAADAGSEQHDSVDADMFARMRKEGAFCVSWDAHGLSYGIPAEVRDAVLAGRSVVANGSRSALQNFAAVFPRLKVVMITARPEVLEQRLAARGREDRDAISRRLERNVAPSGTALDVTTIDNSGRLEDAGKLFIHLIESLLQSSVSQRKDG